jgi:lipopolysaccharide export system permease protein
MAMANFFFVDQVLPRTNARLRSLLNDVAQKKPAFQMREQAINELRPYFIRAGRVFPGSGRLRDVEIYDMSLADASRVIYADSGQMTFDRKGIDLILQLYTGKVHEYKNTDPGQIQVTDFAMNTVRVREVQNKFNLTTDNFQRDDREMTTCEMMDQVTSFQRQAARAAATRQNLVKRDLRTLMRLNQDGLAPQITDTGRVSHCGGWRTLERKIGKLLLPEIASAQEAAQDTVKKAAQDTAKKPAQDTVKKAAPDTARKTAPDSGQKAVADTGQKPAQDSARPRARDEEEVEVATPPPAAAQPPTVPVIPVRDSALTGISPTIMADFAEATSARDDESRAATQARRFAVEIHKKYTISVACFTFVLIGVALALRFPRGGMGLVIGGGLLIFAIFYVSLTGGEALGDRGLVPPAVAMWFPNGLMLVAGIAGLIRVNREFGSTRGGDLGDLVETIRGWFRFRRKEA